MDCFDPQQPFHVPERFQKMYLREYRGPILDWPSYKRLEESPEEIAELRAGYAALTTMCDSYFGRLLDLFDAHDLWQDTDLILTTDHGFLMGEHDCQAKNRMPVYDEIARFPFIMHPPGVADQSGTRRNALTQTMDLMSTLLG